MKKLVSTRQNLWWIIFIAMLIWLPRGVTLDHFVTADEHAWLTRSGNFYRALVQGDYAATFQRHHPGVTVTWAGALGFLVRYPNYAEDSPRAFGWQTEEIEPFLQTQGYRPIEILAAGRWFVVLFITLALTASFGLAALLLGLRPALLGFGLIAFSPFHIGLSRLMHLDGLLSSFMLLAVLAFLAADDKRNSSANNYQTSRLLLVLSGVAAGLAWLTRSPGLFLAPFFALVLLIRGLGSALGESKQLLQQFAVWFFIGSAIFVGLWPAMWVEPWESTKEVLSAARNYAAEGHLKPIFFNGQVHSSDPGWDFYPLTYLWRTTPVTLLGLLSGIIGLLVVTGKRLHRQEPDGIDRDTLVEPTPFFVLWTLLVFAALFGLFMNLGEKKFDRYLLSAYLPLMIFSGWGWYWLFRVISSLYKWRPQNDSRIHGSSAQIIASPMTWGSWGMAIAMSLVVIGQAAFSVPTSPYYLSYYNPVMGGPSQAPKVMQIGWGEGADQAARQLYLQLTAEGIDITQTIVASAYTNGPFSYFFQGKTLPIYFWHNADYAILYAQDFQRRLPSPRQIRYFESLEPQGTVRIDGLTYAHLFDLRGAQLPDYVSDWRPANSAVPQLRLVSYILPSSRIGPSKILPLTLYFENLAPIEQNLSVLVRLVGPNGSEVARSEGWPQGRPTSTWTIGDTWADGHNLVIPANTAQGFYRLDVSFYDPATVERLMVTRSGMDTALGDTLHLDFVEIGSERPRPQSQLNPVANIGNQVSLTGVSWMDEQRTAIDPASQSIIPGDEITLQLHWLTEAFMDRRRTIFAHIVNSEGTLLTQTDEQPWSGFYPTTFWSLGREVVQPLVVKIPDDAKAGTYMVHVGMYDSETVERLPITRNSNAAGDSVVVATLEVAE